MAAPKSRLPLLIGLTAAGGIGYYLYGAGGNAKVAEKDFEHDLSKASSKIKSQVPGKTTEVKKEGQLWGAEAGAKVDSATEKAKAELARGEAYAKDVKKDAMKKVDEFDRKTLAKVDQFDKKVEEGAAKAKSGISSWWGGK